MPIKTPNMPINTCAQHKTSFTCTKAVRVLSCNLYQSSEIETGDKWSDLNYHHLLIISHDMKILGL